MGLKLYSWLILHCWVFAIVILCMSAQCVRSQVYVRFLQTPSEISNLTSPTFAFEVLVKTNRSTYQIAKCTLNNRTCPCESGKVFSCPGRSLSDGDHTFQVCTNGTEGHGCARYHWTIDTQRPTVNLIATTTRRTESSIGISIEFTKPLKRFNYSGLLIDGGKLLSCEPVVNGTKYDVEIQVSDHVIIITFPENVAEDIAGNKNLATNITLKHYPVPLISKVLSTTATTAFAVTSLAAGALTVSTASLQTIGPFSNPPFPTSNPAGNIFGILCHIQVFALSRWLSADTLPVEYDEFSRGLQWSIPYFSLPWESKHTQSLNSHSNNSKISDLVFFKRVLTEENKNGKSTPKPNGSAKCSDPKKKRGWLDFKRSMFWLAVMGGGSMLLHAIVLLVLKLRKYNKTSDKQESYGVITFPRFGIFVILVSLPCICEASAGLVKGRSPSGVAIGTLLLCIVSFLVLALFLLLLIGVTLGKLLQYEEKVKDDGTKYIRLVVGPGKESQWKWKGQPESVHLKILGPVFEELRGPPNDNTSVEKTNDIAPKQLGGGDTSVDENRDVEGNPPKQLSSGDTSFDEIKNDEGNPPKYLGGEDTSVDETTDVEGNPPKQLSSGDTSVDEIKNDEGNPPKYPGGEDTSVDETKDVEGNPPKQLSSGDTSVDEIKNDEGNPPKCFGGQDTSVDETKDVEGNPSKQLGSDTIDETVDVRGNPLKKLGGDTSIDETVHAAGNPMKQLGDDDDTSIEEKMDAGANPPKHLGSDVTSIDEIMDAGGNPPKHLGGDDTPIDEKVDAGGNPPKQLGGDVTSIDEIMDARGNPPKHLGGDNTSIDERMNVGGNPSKQFGGGGDGGGTFVEAPFIRNMLLESVRRVSLRVSDGAYIRKLFGILRIYYMLLESVRRVSLGVSAGAYPNKCSTKTPTIVLLCMSSFQLYFLVLKKPFIKRQNQLVEIIALCSEVGVFAINLVLIENHFSDKKTKGIGIFMLILFLVAFLAQIITQCFALYLHIKQMDTKDGSFLFGLRTASFGFLLFFFPYKLLKDLDGETPKQLNNEIMSKIDSRVGRFLD